MALYAYRVNRRPAGFQSLQQRKDLVTLLCISLGVSLYSVIVVNQLRIRIGISCGAKSQFNVARPNQLKHGDFRSPSARPSIGSMASFTTIQLSICPR